MTEITADIIASPETTDTADSPAPTKTRKEEFRAAMFAAHKAILAQLVELRSRALDAIRCLDIVGSMGIIHPVSF